MRAQGQVRRPVHRSAGGSNVATGTQGKRRFIERAKSKLQITLFPGRGLRRPHESTLIAFAMMRMGRLMLPGV